MPFQHPLLLCPICGEEFRPLRDEKKYCSRTCGKRFNNQQYKIKRAKRAYEIKRTLANAMNLERLYNIPQLGREVSREVLLSGGIDLSAAPKLIKEQESGEHILCYGSYGIKLKDENKATLIRNAS